MVTVFQNVKFALLCFVAACTAGVFCAIPTAARAEYIESFDTTILVQKDSSLVFTEEITYIFDAEKHGIFRFIPLKHPQEATSRYRDRFLDIEITSVRMDDLAVPYEEIRSNDQIEIKIGDPNTTNIGKHRYTIAYTVTGGMSYPQFGGAELYFNVTGDEWEVPIRSASAILTAETSLFTEARSCYRGDRGSTKSCDSVVTGDSAVTFVAHNLGSKEGLTIAQGIDRAQIDYIILERLNPWWVWGIGSLFWFAGLIWFVYSYRTAERTGRSIIPQYDPYPGVKPMYAGLLFDGRLDPRDITAGIVYLAEQGYITIKKTEQKVLFFFEVDDYEIVLKKPVITAPSFEQRILTLIFSPTAREGTVTLSQLKKSLAKQKENQVLLNALKDDLEQNLEEQGFFRVHIPLKYIIGLTAIPIFTMASLAEYVPQLLLPGGIALVSLGILAFMYRRRTRKGYEALDHLRGFKEFLSVTDAERFNFHNAPEKSPEQFMAYLPYAIAFGVEEKWATVFKDITIPDPSWYDAGGAAHFSAMSLTTSLGSFSSALAASSSASGSSASSGGGFSGGGGGGGGGGSW